MVQSSRTVRFTLFTQRNPAAVEYCPASSPKSVNLILNHPTFNDGKLRRGAVALLPTAYQSEIVALGSELASIWRLYIHGQLGVMFAVGSITFLVAWALGLPAPLALGVIAGLLEIIPHIGPILAAIPAVILAMFVGSSRFDIPNLAFAVIVAIAYTLIQQLEDLVLTPRIQGKAIHMSPLIVMISIVIAFEYAGLIGAIVAVPVTASAWLLFNYVYAKVLGHAWPDVAQAEAHIAASSDTDEPNA